MSKKSPNLSDYVTITLDDPMKVTMTSTQSHWAFGDGLGVPITPRPDVCADEMIRICQAVEMKSPNFSIKLEAELIYGGVYLRWSCMVAHRDTGEEIPLSLSRRANASDFATSEAFVEFLFKGYLELWQHEAAETFYVDGQRVFDPHKGELQMITLEGTVKL